MLASDDAASTRRSIGATDESFIFIGLVRDTTSHGLYWAAVSAASNSEISVVRGTEVRGTKGWSGTCILHSLAWRDAAGVDRLTVAAYV